MPTYQFSCKCGSTEEIFRGVLETTPVSCPSCGLAMAKDFTPSTIGHMRGSTPSKGYKETRVRKKRNAALGVKQMERYGTGAKLIPNVDGEETNTWSEASKLAREKGKDVKQFEKLAEQEKHTQNSRGIDERKWKEAKEMKRLN